MNVTNETLSEAVVVFLGFRTSAAPTAAWWKVSEVVGDAIFPALESLMDDYRSIQIDWALLDNDMARGVAKFRETLTGLHPELTAEAIDAMEWKFSWDWR